MNLIAITIIAILALIIYYEPSFDKLRGGEMVMWYGKNRYGKSTRKYIRLW